MQAGALRLILLTVLFGFLLCKWFFRKRFVEFLSRQISNPWIIFQLVVVIGFFDYPVLSYQVDISCKNTSAFAELIY